MDLLKRSWLVVLMTLFVGGTAFSQHRIQLAQGKRAIQDKVTFVVDIAREKGSNPRYEDQPGEMRVWMRFINQPATGRVYVDGKAIGRFDESMSFTSNPIDTTYGRHTITVAFGAPALLMDLYVDLQGGVAREILDDKEPEVMLQPDLSKRVAELERKVTALETELATLKKKRNH